jgi:hypothetical protein
LCGPELTREQHDEHVEIMRGCYRQLMFYPSVLIGHSVGGMMGMMMGKSGSMRAMMSKMMGSCGEDDKTGEGPWDMCRKMMATIGKTVDLATFATPEVRGLFEEWATQIEEEIFQFVKESKTTDADQIAARFKLSKNSANYFLTRLSQQGRISLKAEKAADK